MMVSLLTLSRSWIIDTLLLWVMVDVYKLTLSRLEKFLPLFMHNLSDRRLVSRNKRLELDHLCLADTGNG